MKKASFMLLGTITLIAIGVIEAAPAASASQSRTILANCVISSADFQVARSSGAVTGTATLSDCIVPGRPDIHSATVSMSGHTTLLTAILVMIDTTDTITWNTGESTTVTQTRTFTGASSVIEVGDGVSLAGLLHPSAEAETSTGTRTNPTSLAATRNFHAQGNLALLVNLITNR